MKIEIDIDIEALVRDEVRKFIQENLVINNVASTEEQVTVKEVVVPTVTRTRTKVPTPPPEGWEFAKKDGKRRSKEMQALHDLELKLGRRLTPEEKGERSAIVELDEEKEQQAKEEALKKAHIAEMVEEGLAKANEELSDEKEVTEIVTEDKITVSDTIDFMEKVEEPSVPKTDSLPIASSLFSNS